jgi:hypothetical protein
VYEPQSPVISDRQKRTRSQIGDELLGVLDRRGTSVEASSLRIEHDLRGGESCAADGHHVFGNVEESNPA